MGHGNRQKLQQLKPDFYLFAKYCLFLNLDFLLLFPFSWFDQTQFCSFVPDVTGMTEELNILKGFQESLQHSKAFAGTLDDHDRRSLVLAFRNGLVHYKHEILRANRNDVEVAFKIPGNTLINRLALTAARIDSLCKALEELASTDDVVGKCTLATEISEGLHLYRTTVPLGVLLIIFEARPDAFIQIAALGLKSGNVCLLKGGSESCLTNAAIYSAFLKGVEVLCENSGADRCEEMKRLVRLVDDRDDVKRLLQLENTIDMVIPRGSNSLIQYVKQNTNIPVLGHADGICFAFVDFDGASTTDRLRAAVSIIRDSKLQYASACNSLEVLLVHEDAANQLLPILGEELAKEGVIFKADKDAAKLLPSDSTHAACPMDFKTEWLGPLLSVGVVKSIHEAILMINKNGSHHTDLIISYNPQNIELFMRQVDSADVFCNCSTRFADGFRFGFKAEVGIGTGKVHARGPVGLEGLTTYQYRLYGNGHTVGSFNETESMAIKAYTHKPLFVLEKHTLIKAPLDKTEDVAKYEQDRLNLPLKLHM